MDDNENQPEIYFNTTAEDDWIRSEKVINAIVPHIPDKDLKWREKDRKILVKAFDESKHPRHAEGPQGGEFERKGEGDEAGSVPVLARWGADGTGIRLNDEQEQFVESVVGKIRIDESKALILRGKEDIDITDKIAKELGIEGMVKETDRKWGRGRPEEQYDGMCDLSNATDEVRGKRKDAIVTDLWHRLGIHDFSYDKVDKIVQQWADTSNDDSHDSLIMQQAVSEELGAELSDWQKKKVQSFAFPKEAADPKVKEEKLKAYLGEYRQKISHMQDRMKEILDNNPRWQPIDAYEEVIRTEGEQVKPQFGKESYFGNPALRFAISQEFEDVLVSELPQEEAEKTIINAVKNYRFDPEAYWFTEDDGRKIVRAMYNATQEYFAKLGYKPDDEITLFRGTHANLGKYGAGQMVTLQGNAAESWTLNPEVAFRFGTTLMAKVRVKDILSTFMTGIGCMTENEVVVLNRGQGSAKLIWDSKALQYD